MGYIDAHVHVWTPDTAHYPLAPGFKKGDMDPPSFTPEQLFKHTRPAGVDRINLIQMSYYGFDNRYMLDMMALYKGTFSGTAVIDPAGRDPGRLMTELAKKGVRAFRVYPGLERGTKANAGSGEGWLKADGYARMFATAARNNQAISCLIGPDALPDLERTCKKYPNAPVIVDHLCRIGADGTIRARDVDALCKLAAHRRVLIKVGAFYALGKKEPPYTDLAPMIEKVVKAFGARRCTWESDCPFQVVKQKYRDSLDLVRKRLDFLSDDDRAWMLRRTAEEFFFPK